MVVGGDLYNESHRQDHTPEGDAQPSTNVVGKWRTNQGSNESANAEHADYESRSDVAEVVRSVVMPLTEPLEKVWHFQESGNLTGIIAESGRHQSST
jgi:hypothetical protein